MDNLNFALTVTAMGMGITFLVLILLSIILGGMNKLWDRYFLDAPAQKNTAPAEKEAQPQAAVEQVPELTRTVKEEDHRAASAVDDGSGIPAQVVAAITAALSVTLGRPSSEIQMASVRKVGASGGPGYAWSQAGRLEVIHSRQRFTERKGK